jgi:hypothetical protein
VYQTIPGNATEESSIFEEDILLKRKIVDVETLEVGQPRGLEEITSEGTSLALTMAPSKDIQVISYIRAPRLKIPHVFHERKAAVIKKLYAPRLLE